MRLIQRRRLRVRFPLWAFFFPIFISFFSKVFCFYFMGQRYRKFYYFTCRKSYTLFDFFRIFSYYNIDNQLNFNRILCVCFCINQLSRSVLNLYSKRQVKLVFLPIIETWVWHLTHFNGIKTHDNGIFFWTLQICLQNSNRTINNFAISVGKYPDGTNVSKKQNQDELLIQVSR